MSTKKKLIEYKESTEMALKIQAAKNSISLQKHISNTLDKQAND
jgi:predicted HicB family RNase H-like nuclease